MTLDELIKLLIRSRNWIGYDVDVLIRAEGKTYNMNPEIITARSAITLKTEED